MGITLHGPDRYPSVVVLRHLLAGVPEVGTFTLGGAKILATEQLRRFAEAGLVVPEWTTDFNLAWEWVGGGDTVYGRREEHSQGKDIVVYKLPHGFGGARNRYRFHHRDWWCKFVPSIAEWRIHVFDGRCIARGKKVFTGTPPPGDIRSRRLGWTMVHTLEPSEAVRRAGKAAIAALGYSYGAVDILETVQGPVVLEANLLPAMDAYTATAYVNAIRRRVAGRRVVKLTFPGTPYEGVEVW